LARERPGFCKPRDVVMRPDLPFAMSGPYVVQSTWSPTGLAVRLTVGSVGPATIEQLRPGGPERDGSAEAVAAGQRRWQAA
jgi:hypothetical protein